MYLTDEELLKNLRSMDEYDFEELIADLWERQGWNTTVTPNSNDRGIDVIAQKDMPFYQKQLIQAKRYSSGNNVGTRDIQQYNSLKDQVDDADTVVVVTTSNFTSPAEDIAHSFGVKLINGKEIVSIVNKLDSDEIIDKWITDENTPKYKNNNTSFKNNTNNNKSIDSPKLRKTDIKSFKKCPICRNTDLTVDRSPENIITRCEKCKSGWERQKISNNVGGYRIAWQGISGTVQGKSKTMSEWTAHATNSTRKRSQESTDDPVFFDKLAGILLTILLFSTLHSLLTWSFYSYQLWLVILSVISLLGSVTIKLFKKSLK